jgi:hypothetical protein
MLSVHLCFILIMILPVRSALVQIMKTISVMNKTALLEKDQNHQLSNFADIYIMKIPKHKLIHLYKKEHKMKIQTIQVGGNVLSQNFFEVGREDVIRIEKYVCPDGLPDYFEIIKKDEKGEYIFAEINNCPVFITYQRDIQKST